MQTKCVDHFTTQVNPHGINSLVRLLLHLRLSYLYKKEVIFSPSITCFNFLQPTPWNSEFCQTFCQNLLSQRPSRVHTGKRYNHTPTPLTLPYVSQSHLWLLHTNHINEPVAPSLMLQSHSYCGHKTHPYTCQIPIPRQTCYTSTHLLHPHLQQTLGKIVRDKWRKNTKISGNSCYQTKIPAITLYGQFSRGRLLLVNLRATTDSSKLCH